MDNKKRYSYKEEYETTTSSKDNFQSSKTEGTDDSNLNNPDLIVGRYLIYDSRTRRCYARNNSIEITTPRDGNHISKMVDAILGCASPNSVKEVISRSSLSHPRIPLPEPLLPPFKPSSPSYPPPSYSQPVVSRILPPPLPSSLPNSPPLVSLLPESPLTPKGPRQVIQATPKSTPRQWNQNTLTDNNSPPYSPFPDSYFAQFDVPSPPVSGSPVSTSYYSDGSELLYSNASNHNSPTTPKKNISETPTTKSCSQYLRNLNEGHDPLSTRKTQMTNLIYNELSPSPNYRNDSKISTYNNYLMQFERVED